MGTCLINSLLSPLWWSVYPYISLYLGGESLLYLPDINSAEDYDCKCGYSAVMNRLVFKLGKDLCYRLSNQSFSDL